MSLETVSNRHLMSRDDLDDVHLVTGGGGYTGFKLGRRLAEIGKKVILVDIVPPKWPLIRNMSFVQCDLTKDQAVASALRGADCVFHLASYGMSGKEQFNAKLIEEVNINGTENVIRACLQHGIRRLVYTSSNNVVFGGQEIRNGNESLPYPPLGKFLDHYSKTKRIAEQIVLEADKECLLRTCALRLGGVYGVGELRHIPRVVNMAQTGVIQALFGAESLTDFLHVDNMVQAHILAAKALTKEESHKAGGQTYFISDGAPINTFSFFRPLIEGLGYSLPRRQIPIRLMCCIAWVIEMIHFLVSGIYDFQPVLTRMEVYKMGVTNYFCIKKASRDLGYKPVKQNEISDVLGDLVKRGFRKKQMKTSLVFRMNWFANIVITVIFTSFVLSYIPLWNLSTFEKATLSVILDK
ncbi:short-chain dehydrogenase/reductase family 42E member 1-like [Ostrea edulis]|uniref:short-chain dehydrogenase/reductase family 42E member 1-like n=1 Tax=Ostrea edulis TaxID=37623 RepID=UPI0024AFD623|nr:short-chain dehydrogenase/reductase family 42E member 1-like [Ostrea edulis]XP_056018789.1 short-chain dehydrogenase/reductase family 42E member 1-like [Ostrea edulis]